MKKYRLLLIDPDPKEAAISRLQLGDINPTLFEFEHCLSVQSAIASHSDDAVDAIIVDVNLEKQDELLDLSLLCRNYFPMVPVIVYTAHGNLQQSVVAMRAGAEDFVLKGDMEPEQVVWGVFRAIERKKVESSLRAQQSLLSQILDSMPDGVATADANGNLTFFNKAASALAGIGLTDSTPPDWQHTYGIFRKDRVTPYPDHETPLFKAIQGEEVTDQHLFVRHAGLPEGRLLSLNGRPLVDQRGRRLGGIVCFREIIE